MFQILHENLMNALNLLKGPTNLVARGRQVFVLSAFASFFGFHSRFFFICRANQDDALFPQGLGLRLVRNVAFEKQASYKPHNRAPLSSLKALVIQKFPRCLSGTVTAFCRFKNLFESYVEPLRRKYAINLSNTV